MFSAQGLVQAVVLLIVLGLVFWLLHWLIDYINPPQPFNKVARVVLVVAAVLVCIAVLLQLAGAPLVRWGP